MYNKIRNVLIIIGLVYFYLSLHYMFFTKSQLQTDLENTIREVDTLKNTIKKLEHATPRSAPIEGGLGLGLGLEESPEEKFKRMVKTRDIPDARPKECLSLTYSKDLPTASVVIVDHNEEDSLVVRTVKSVLERTPPELLKDIIVIDDCSSPALISEVAILPKTLVIRNEVQRGLIQARNLGAEKSKGDVIIFLDAHCEANVGWLEPLLEIIKAEPKTVVWPVIDVIDHTNYQYTVIDGDKMVGALTLQDMHFIYDDVPEYAKKMRTKSTDYLVTPSFPGGLFAIGRGYWNTWGGYDTEMGLWGTENIDMSTRIWLCGGKLVVAPCSHVGHVYRDKNRVPTYVTGSGIKARVRMAEVWLGDYKYAFFNRYGINQTMIDQAGDLTQMKKIRDTMNCKPFKWFHQNIYPHMEIPHTYLDDPDYDIWWPDVFSSGRIDNNKPHRAVVAFLDSYREFLAGAQWAFYSLNLIGAENTDLFLFFEERGRQYVPTDCKILTKEEMYDIELTPHKQPRCYAVIMQIPTDVSNLKFPTLGEVYPMAKEAGFQDKLREYGYIVRTDLSSFFTPQFANWYPPANKPFQVGTGAYVHDDKTKQKLAEIAGELKLRYQHFHNLGYSWYGKASLVVDIADLAFTTTKHILQNHFKEGPGEWPSWYKGVSLKYGSEIAINHLVDQGSIETNHMDGSSNSGRTCSVVHIRCMDGHKGFKRDTFLSKGYDGEDVDSLPVKHTGNYALYVALKSSGKDKSEGKIVGLNTEDSIRSLCKD